MTATEKAALERRIDELCAEVERLRQELAIRESSEQEKVIDYLGKECADWEVQYLTLAGENTKLRELVKAMTPFLCCMPFASCNTLAASVRKRMSELGIEVG